MRGLCSCQKSLAPGTQEAKGLWPSQLSSLYLCIRGICLATCCKVSTLTTHACALCKSEPLILKYLIWKCFIEIKIYSPYHRKCLHSLCLERRVRTLDFSFVIISNVVNFGMAVKLVLKIVSLSFVNEVIDGDCQNSEEVIIKKSWGIIARSLFFLHTGS